MGHCPTFLVGSEMGTTFLRSDSDNWGQGLKWGQSESRDNMLFLPQKASRILISSIFMKFYNQIDMESNVNKNFLWYFLTP